MRFHRSSTDEGVAVMLQYLPIMVLVMIPEDLPLGQWF